VLRIFKLSSGQDDHAIMFMDDYLKQVAFAIKRSGGKEQDGNEVFEWFERYVVPSKLDVSINQLELCSLLSRGGDVTDKHITLLMNAGLLTRQLIDPNIYWFAIPRIGPILKGLSQGRKEILSLLNRKKYKEMLLSSLEKTKLRLSPLDTRFLLRFDWIRSHKNSSDAHWFTCSHNKRLIKLPVVILLIFLPYLIGIAFHLLTSFHLLRERKFSYSYDKRRNRV